MIEFLKSQKLKSLLPYFLLVATAIVIYRFVDNLGFFADFFVGALKRVLGIIIPFVYGAVIAYIADIPCSAAERLLGKVNNKFVKKRKRALSVLIIILILILLIFSVLSLIIPSVRGSISFFIENYQTYYDRVYEIVMDVVDYISNFEIFGMQISVDGIFEIITDGLQNSAENISSSLRAILGVSSSIFRGFLAFVSAIYYLLEKEKFHNFICRLLKAFSSSGVYNFIMKISGKLNKNFKQYIYTQTIDGCILGTLVTIELFLIGSPYFLILGLMLGIVNYIPYFGSIFGSIIASLVVLITQGLSRGLITGVVLLITQQIDGNIIQPKLMGGSFSLSPLLIIISVTVGGAFFGIIGMLAAIPIVAVLKDMLDEIIAAREKINYKGSE